MAMEARPVLRLLAPWKRFTAHGLPMYRLSPAGTECVLVESGMGADRAAGATEALLAAFSPRYLVSFGIAGAVEPDIHIGDVIVARHVASFEHGDLGQGRALASLSQEAHRAAGRATESRDARLYLGTAITTAGPQPSLSKLGALTHPILEMETAAIARVAEEHGTPLLSIRSVSDAPEEPIPMPFEYLIDERGALRIGRIVGELLRHLSLLPRLIRVGRNGAKASENAAVVVAAILENALNALGD